MITRYVSITAATMSDIQGLMQALTKDVDPRVTCGSDL